MRSNGAGGCGSTISFDIANFGAFIAADPFKSNAIFAAVDIFDKSTGTTFVVGLTDDPTPTTRITPTPLPGAVWMFGAGLGGLGLLMRRRRKQNQEAA